MWTLQPEKSRSGELVSEKRTIVSTPPLLVEPVTPDLQTQFTPKQPVPTPVSQNQEVPLTSSNTVVSSEEAVDFLADEVQYDEPNSIVRAIGSVELVQAGRILYADEIIYHLNTDRVEAAGNVALNEVNGDTYFADSLELEDKMKDGFVRGLSGALADGSRFSAETAQKIADLKIIMNKAQYTACEPCRGNPDKPPIWQIKARNVTHHKDEARVSYNDATFEVAGLPVAYLPYFSHPDGSIDRKSGFLTPTIGFDSDLGSHYTQ